MERRRRHQQDGHVDHQRHAQGARDVEGVEPEEVLQGRSRLAARLAGDEGAVFDDVCVCVL